MDIYENAVTEIVSAIVKFFDGKVKSLPFDRTYQGIVVGSVSENICKVKIQGAVYTVPCITNQQINMNDNVLVLSKQNDMKQLYLMGCCK